METCRKCGRCLQPGQAFCPACFTVQAAKKRGRNRPRLLLFWKELTVCLTVLTAAALAWPFFRTSSEPPILYTAGSAPSLSSVGTEASAFVSEESSKTSVAPSSATVTSPEPTAMPIAPMSEARILEYLGNRLGSQFQQTSAENKPYMYCQPFDFSAGAQPDEAVRKIANFLEEYQKGFLWPQVRVSYHLEYRESSVDIQIYLYYGTPPGSLETVSAAGESIAKAARARLRTEFQHVDSCNGGGSALWTAASLSEEQAVDALCRDLTARLRANRHTAYTFWYCGTGQRGGEFVHVFHYMTPPIEG